MNYNHEPRPRNSRIGWMRISKATFYYRGGFAATDQARRQLPGGGWSYWRIFS